MPLRPPINNPAHVTEQAGDTLEITIRRHLAKAEDGSSPQLLASSPPQRASVNNTPARRTFMPVVRTVSFRLNDR